MTDQRDRIVTVARTLGAVGHQVSGPLQSIINAMFLARREDERAGRLLDERLTPPIDRLRTAVEGLERLSRVCAPAQKERLALADLLEATRARCSDPDRVDVTGLSLAVHADPDQLAAALGELVANALEHGAPGEAVSVDVRGVDGRVDVRVQGGNVDRWPAPVDAALDPFFSTTGRALGLGLPIAQVVAESHGGHLHLAPLEVGVSVVMFSLPEPA